MGLAPPTGLPHYDPRDRPVARTQVGYTSEAISPRLCSYTKLRSVMQFSRRGAGLSPPIGIKLRGGSKLLPLLLRTVVRGYDPGS